MRSWFLAVLLSILAWIPASTALADLVCTSETVASLGRFGEGALSGDGRRLAYLSSLDLDGEPFRPVGLRLFLWEEGGGTRLLLERPVNIEAPGPVGPSISDDGRRIVVRDEHGELLLWDEEAGFTQLTDTGGRAFRSVISGDGHRIAFVTDADLLGENPDGGLEVFLWDEAVGLRQVTTTVDLFHGGPVLDQDGDRMAFAVFPADGLPDSPRGIFLWQDGPGAGVLTQVTGLPTDPPLISADGRRIAFTTDQDPLGTNRGFNREVFLWDEAEGLRQLTESRRLWSLADPSFGDLSGDGDRVVFTGHADLTGTNPLEDTKVFLWDEAEGLTQITLNPFERAFGATLSNSGDRLAYVTKPRMLNSPADTGELHVATCGEPPPPAGDWLTSAEVPGFEFKVRIGPLGQEPIAGPFEPECIPETLCVSGAVTGRVEALLRVVGPKPNGRLWPMLVKFSTSPVQVWVRQVATETVRHYLLHGAQPRLDVLFGVADREGFAPAGAGPAAARAASAPVSVVPEAASCVLGEGPKGLTPGSAQCPEKAAPEPPAGPYLESPDLPDFRFKVRITPRGGEPQLVVQEPRCIAEALCVSGAVPGRSELFIRIVGPKPNGNLWPILVRFSTSKVEVWIDQVSTGAKRYYRLQAVKPGGDDIPGLFDRDGFTP